MEQLESRIETGRQEELVERHCGRARALLEESRNREEALNIRDWLCSRLAGECASSLVLNATRTYIDDLIKSKWG